jgi:hypothetical protein
MSITTDIARGCKDLQGGIDTFYICNWVNYSRTKIVTTGQVLTTFPSTVVYKIAAVNINFTEAPSIEGGSEKWDQSFTFDVPKTAVTSELFSLLKRNFRIFYVDRIGNTRVLGLKNGLTGVVSNESGTEKAGLNGYRVSGSGLENNQAYFVSDLAALGISFDYLNAIFQDGNNKIFQDGNNKIYN